MRLSFFTPLILLVLSISSCSMLNHKQDMRYLKGTVKPEKYNLPASLQGDPRYPVDKTQSSTKHKQPSLLPPSMRNEKPVRAQAESLLSSIR